jgi:hypothetical protein
MGFLADVRYWPLYAEIVSIRSQCQVDDNESRVAKELWLGREDSNLRMTESKSVALPLGDAPSDVRA